MSNLKWILSQWHAISSSSAPIKMDGVLYNDIWSIIDTMLKYPNVKKHLESLNKVYDHLADYDNPHKVTIDQLPTSVIEYIYGLWREEGYEGSIEFFITLLFTYLEIIQYEELIEGDNIHSEELIPSVAAVTKYIKAHNDSIHVHDIILSRVFGGEHIHNTPTYSFFQMLGVSQTFRNTYNNATLKRYRNIPMFDAVSRLPMCYAIAAGARFNGVNGKIFAIHTQGNTSQDDLAVYFNSPNNTVELWKNRPATGIAGGTLQASIDISEYLQSRDFVDGDDAVVGVVLSVNKYLTSLRVLCETKTLEDSTLYKVIFNTKVGTGHHGPTNPRLDHCLLRDHTVQEKASSRYADDLYGLVCYFIELTDGQAITLLRSMQQKNNRTNLT